MIYSLFGLSRNNRNLGSGGKASSGGGSGISNYYSLKTNYSTGDLFSRLQHEVPNIPFEWLNGNREGEAPAVDLVAAEANHMECGRKPHLKDLMINNNIWQR